MPRRLCFRPDHAARKVFLLTTGYWLLLFIHHSSLIIPHFQFVGMNFWHNMQAAAGIDAFLWVALGFAAVASALFYFKPASRARIRAAAVLFGLACAGMLAAAALLSYGAD